MNHFRGQSSSRPPFGHAGCRSIAKYAVSVLAGTSQVDFEVDCRHLHACPPEDLLITMVKETVILYKKEFRKMKEKSYLSLI